MKAKRRRNILMQRHDSSMMLLHPSPLGCLIISFPSTFPGLSGSLAMQRLRDPVQIVVNCIMPWQPALMLLTQCPCFCSQARLLTRLAARRLQAPRSAT